MKISLDDNSDQNNRIASYDTGLFLINGETYTHSIIITRNTLVEHWPPITLEDLATQHIEQLINLDPEIIILGTGKQQLFPSVEILAPVYDAGMGLEIMDTGAACRSFNLLASEGRKVAAGLILIRAS